MQDGKESRETKIAKKTIVVRFDCMFDHETSYSMFLSQIVVSSNLSVSRLSDLHHIRVLTLLFNIVLPQTISARLSLTLLCPMAIYSESVCSRCDHFRICQLLLIQADEVVSLLLCLLCHQLAHETIVSRSKQ